MFEVKSDKQFRSSNLKVVNAVFCAIQFTGLLGFDLNAIAELRSDGERIVSPLAVRFGGSSESL